MKKTINCKGAQFKKLYFSSIYYLTEKLRIRSLHLLKTKVSNAQKKLKDKQIFT